MTNRPRVEVLETTRKAWVLASTFPVDKEAVYPDHARVQEFDQHQGKRVLEYGCGNGSDAISYLKRGNEVWFCDIVQANLDFATKRIEGAGFVSVGHPVYLEASAPLPLESNFFDVASSHGVVHHIPNAEPVVREFHRVLKPGGVLYLMLYTEHLWANCLKEMQQRVASGKMLDLFAAFSSMTDYGTPYARSYTEQEGREFIEGAGFQIAYAVAWNGGEFRTFKAIKR